MLGCGKDDHKVSDYPTIGTRGREAKQVLPNDSHGGALKRNHFYVFLAKGQKRMMMMMPVIYRFLSLVMSYF